MIRNIFMLIIFMLCVPAANAGFLDKVGAIVDFAGVRLTKDTPFKVNARSRLVLSVSRAGETRYLHSDRQLENTVH